MDDKSQKSSSFGTIGFMIAAIIFAAVAGILLSQVMESTYSQEPVKPVVVVARAVPASQPLKKEDLRLSSWPESSIPAGAFQKVEDVLEENRVPLIPFVPGEAILKNHLSKPHSGMGIAPVVDPGKRAMSISTDDPVTLSRLIYPGARIDVLATIRETWVQQEGEPNVSTKLVLQNIKVLAVGEDIDPLTISERRRARRKKEEEGALSGEQYESKELRAVVTVLVSPDEAERLALARREGKIDIVLRNPKDTATVETEGATPLAFVPMDEEGLAGDVESMFSMVPDGDGSQPKKTRRRRRPSRTRGADKAKPAPKKRGSGVVIIK